MTTSTGEKPHAGASRLSPPFSSVLDLIGVPVGQGLTDADDRGHPRSQGGCGLGSHQRAGFTVQGPAFRVPAQRPGATEVGQHGRSDFTGVGTLGMDADVLATPGNRCARQRIPHLCQVRKRHAHSQLGLTRPRRVGGQAVQQRGIGREAAVHLPIAHDEALASVAHEYRRSSQTGMITASTRCSMEKAGRPCKE